ncbi:hypothetical protein BJX99DRAFT_153096 [Aspergillus californicus]
MSFLDSVLSSIETGKPNPIPTSSPAPSPTISSMNARPEPRRPTPASRPVSVERKNGVNTGNKRKAEEPLPRNQKPGSQIPARPAPVRPAPVKPANKPASFIQRPLTTSKLTKPSTSNAPSPQKATPVSLKPPPKGSYAEIMAQAKTLQQTAPTQIGMFKHQSVPKEKLSKMERKKRMLEAQAKEKNVKNARKSSASSASLPAKPGSAKALSKREPEDQTYKGTARPPPPPPPPQPEYRGTANLPGRNGDRRGQLKSNKRSRFDEYLGTDEEDEGEYADDYEDYYSESSDMEAGLDDVEGEERAALLAAKREDEEDIRAEAAAKAEKLDRRQKLSMLASKRR